MVVRSNQRNRLKYALFATPLLRLSRQQSALISFPLILIILSAEFSVSRLTNSLLLFNAGLVQLALALFILMFMILSSRSGRAYAPKMRLGTALITGFAILLLSVYIFIEIYLRLIGTFTYQPSSVALLTAIAGLIGNIIVLRILLNTNLFQLKFGSFKIPVLAMMVLSIGVFLAIAVIHCTDYFFLDTVLSLLFGLSISVWAAFIMMDAYWHISELAKA